MKAILQERYGPPESLRVGEVARPTPGPGQVLVRVVAASINARDWHVLRGDPYLARLADRATFGRHGPRQPVAGTDFAGIVEAVGSGVAEFAPGDEVFGEAPGALAEFVVADRVTRKPARLSFEQAAAIPLAGNTALVGLREARVRPGQRLLINGASGGVGTFAVQLGRLLGARVTAVCSARNVALVESLGATRVIDYAREDFARPGASYDVVLDLVCDRPLGQLRRVVEPHGVLILVGGGVFRGVSALGPMGLHLRGMLADRFVGQRVVSLTAVPSRANLDELARLAEVGEVTPVVDRVFALDDAPAAIAYLEREHARAKVVVRVGER